MIEDNKKVLSVLGSLTILTSIGVLVSFGWISASVFFNFYTLVFALLGLAVLGVSFVIIKFGDEGSRGFDIPGGRKSGEITKAEADKVTRYALFEKNMFVGSSIEKGIDNEGDEDSSTRIYTHVFEERYSGERIAVVLDVDQNINVNTGSVVDLRETTRKIENMKIIKKDDRSKEEFREKIQDVRESMALIQSREFYRESVNPQTGETEIVRTNIPQNNIQTNPNNRPQSNVDVEENVQNN